MSVVRCDIVKWVADDPIPGWIEARLTDVHGKIWVFFDKPPVFTTDRLTAATRLPVPGAMRCEVINRRVDSRRTVVTVRTLDVQSDGKDQFDVDATQVVTE